MPTTFAPWVPIYPTEIGGASPELTDALVRLGTKVLWAKTGRRFGQAYAVGERYRAAASASCECLPWMDANGSWQVGCEPRDCCALSLYSQPVRQVDEVRLGGQQLDPAGYDLEGATLRRLGTCWPIIDACDAAVIEVDYTWGIDVPVEGLLALGEWVTEALIGAAGGACRLPSRMIALVRQGVTMDFESASVFMDRGRVGLPLCDAWIDVENPHALKQRARVFSPDLGRRTG